MRVILAALVACAALIVGAAPASAAPPAAPHTPPAVPAWRAASRVAVITQHGAIDDISRSSILRRISRAEAEGAKAIVLELDTPGGELGPTLQLCLAIKDDIRTPVYAWVRPRAYSAGTILALACRGILVSPGSSFGDAAPIQAVPGMGLIPLPGTERAKIEAPVLAEVVDSARRNHYDEALVRTFVTAPDEVWLLEDTRTGKRVFVGRREYRDIFGAEPPEQRGPGSRDTVGSNFEIEPRFDDRFRQPAGAPAGTPTGTPTDTPSAADIAEREKHVEFLQVRRPTRAPLTAADADHLKLVAQVDGPDELLVVYAPEARAYGLADAEIADDRQLADYFGATQLVRLDEHAGDAIVRFLTSWPVRALLIIVLLVGFFVEVAAPGVGWFGAAAVCALALLLGAPILGGLQSWWPVVLVAIGIVLLLLEIFVIPGFGVTGILGAGCVIVGLLATFVDQPLSSAEGQVQLANALALMVGAGILSTFLTWWALRLLPQTAVGRAVILHATTDDAAPGDRALRQPHLQIRLGQVGVTITPLRPVGKVDFDGTLVEVQSPAGYVDEGRRVVVTSATAYAVEVEELPA